MALEWQYPFGRMPAYQYHFVVLARLPGSYGYLKDLLSFQDPRQLDLRSASPGYYRLAVLPGDQPPALPAHALYWTSIACVLWDDADPDQLRPEQQVALLDWLHWGGQLIISGPDSLDDLRHSFLGPFLPATSAGAGKLSADDLKPLSHFWSASEKKAEPLIPVQPWPAVRLERHPLARELPGTKGLLLERRVGRGRIVVSAFRLTSRDLIAWKSFDNFFNACLLRRPPRRFYEGDLMPRVTWDYATGAPRAPPKPNSLSAETSTWEPGPLELAATDARQVSKVRFFARDTGRALTASPSTDSFGASEQHLPDVAAWNDFNAVAGAARTALKDAARIDVPQARFVVWVLAGYLAVLVPLNWTFFRLLGRVEWAWAAAPVIAIVCTVLVVRLARLDIGFARSSTEIALLETQSDYARAHAARYTALYTSLFTRYRLASDDLGLQTAPFPTVERRGDFRLAGSQSIAHLSHHHRAAEVALEGFSVASNSTSFLHSEQFVDLGGPIALVEAADGSLSVSNRTTYCLRGTGLVRRARQRPEGVSPSASPVQEVAWLGTLEPGGTVPARFQPDANALAQGWDESLESAASLPQGQLNAQALLDVAAATDLEEGELRLVAWFDEPLPGWSVTPAAPQVRQLTVVVAHLRHGSGSDPRPDVNCLEDVQSSTFSQRLPAEPTGTAPKPGDALPPQSPSPPTPPARTP